MTDKILKLPFPFKAGEPTMNGHIYPREVLQTAIDDWQNRIREKSTWGETNSNHGHARLSHVSHIIVGLALEEDTLVASAKVLDTKCGQILAEFDKIGVELVFNPIGRGDIDPDTGIVSNYKLDLINIEGMPAKESEPG